MKIQKGIVKYKDREDIECLYGTTDEGKAYYFLDETDTKKLANGNRVASTVLVEAIDPMVKATSVGLISEDGVEVLPCANRTIRPIADNAILVEPAEPISESVIEANTLRSDPLAATRLVSTPAVIKEKINAQMGGEGRYIFNDQFSEATICDIDGNNKLGNEYYSFIGMNADKLYLAKNTQDTEIKEFSLSTMDYVSNENNIEATPAQEEAIDVSAVEVPTNVVENAVEGEQSVVETPEIPQESVDTPLEGEKVSAEDVATTVGEETPVENVNQGFSMDDMQAVSLGEEQMVSETPVEEVAPVENANGEEITVPTEKDAQVAETPVEEVAPVEDTIGEEITVPTEEDAQVAETPVEEAAPVENANGEEITAPAEDVSQIEEAPVDENASFDFKMENMDEEKEVTEEENTDIPQDDNLDTDYEMEDSELDKYFKDYSTVKTDKIEDYDIDDYTVVDDFDDSKLYKDDTNGKARVVTDLVNAYREEKSKNEKLMDSRRSEMEKSRMKDEKIDILTAQTRSYKAEITKLESRSSMLQDEIRERERKIESLQREISSLRQKQEKYNELDRALEDAKALLDNEDNYSKEVAYYR